MSVELVRKIARCLSTLPPAASQQAVASYNADADAVAEFIGAGLVIDENSAYSRALMMRNLIMERVRVITEMRDQASANGYILPDSPFEVIASLDYRTKVLFGSVATDGQRSIELASAAKDLADVYDAVVAGTIDFSTPKNGTSQISSFDMSVDGLVGSSTGDALADIIGYQPDADLLKRKRAVDALATLNFDRRRPKVLFISEETVLGRPVVTFCWMKIRDASSYVITKRDVFSGEKFAWLMTNEQLAAQQGAAAEALSFYDDVRPDDVWTFVDNDIRKDALYAYSVIARRANSSGARNTFSFPTSPLFVSPAQLAAISAAITADASTFGSEIESVNPYPAISQVVYGDSRYDWVLAAVNFLSARSRGATDAEVRRSSYLGAKLSTVTDALAAGTFVAPDDLAAVISSIELSVSSFGVSQAILDVLDATGSTLFISSEDDPSGFQETNVAVEIASGGLSKILQSIDPESATIDPATLIANISSQSSLLQNYRAREIDAEDRGQEFLSLIGADVIDLTSYDGISRLMRAIRTFYDISSLRF